MTPTPQTRADDLTETLHGHQVADPYRWLEGPDQKAVDDWVAEQRGHADKVLGRLPMREWFTEVMRRIVERPRIGTPWRQGGLYLQERRLVGQKQSVVHVADSLEELLTGGRVLADPNQWDESGTTSVSFVCVNPQGSLVALGRSEAGSDWTHVSIVDGDGAVVEADAVTTRFADVVWLPDGQSFVHQAYPGAARTDGTSTAQATAAHLRVHRVGTSVDEDLDFFDFEQDPRQLCWLELSDDDQWLVAHVSRGTERTNQLWLFHVHGETDPDGTTRSTVGQRVRVVEHDEQVWHYLGSAHGEIYLLTDDDAPNSRIVALDEQDWELREVVGERQWPLRHAVLAHDALVCLHLEDAQPVVRRHDLYGAQKQVVELQAGAVTALNATADSEEVFLGASTIDDPQASWCLDCGTGELRELEVAGIDQEAFTVGHGVERHQATSADGTEVPFFLVRPQGAPAGPLPMIVYGYGGFDVEVLADHRPIWPAWLAAGGGIAIANLRGGGEFGREWYEGGIRENKQKVFDDMIAVAETLIAEGHTTAQQLAVYGKSNGGLLVGAVMTQRPELFAAALLHVGVLDAVRFHRFTIGHAWTSDYGDPEVEADLGRILEWSPLHNVRSGVTYPATLVMTSDHDDRVVPAHSYKFAAAVQAAQAGPAPVVCRIDEATGHGLANRSPEALVAESADMLAFAAQATGLDNPPRSRG
ncbi:prolyl oligopeptidase family serine peptidase [Luteococcus sp.]|uniref:prolyl oligopeptidase family serine peptidase n=1 Tax=Luteococcus sp. TaxID=1969402 RepID=UPI0037364122